MPNNSKLRRKRKEWAKMNSRYEVNTDKPARYPKVVGNAPGVTQRERAKRRAVRLAEKAEERKAA